MNKIKRSFAYALALIMLIGLIPMNVSAAAKIAFQLERAIVYENGTENYENWCFKKDFFTRLKKVQFEDYYFWAPEQYDEYLKIAYGNYMELPPIKERENKHLIVAIDFGENEN